MNGDHDAAETHRHFAKEINGEVWRLLETSDRTRLEDLRMVHAAHASCYHWLLVGSAVHQQRSEWLIARVYCELGLGESALYHANRCLELTNDFVEEMTDFDRAYAYEGMARAHAVANQQAEALHHRDLAQQAGLTIADDEDRGIFLKDLQGGNWHGLRTDP